MISETIEAEDSLPLTVPELIHRNNAQRGAQVALATDLARLTYHELNEHSSKIARGFLAAGASKGTHIGLLLPNGGDFLICLLAAARIGAVALPFSTLSTPDELRQLLIQSDTEFLVAQDNFRGRNFAEIIGKALPGFDEQTSQPLRMKSAPWLRRVWILGGADDANLEALAASGRTVSNERLEAAERSVRLADRFAIIHTSGSTSTPKGIVHQHGSLLRHINNINEIRNLGPDDVLFSTAPWFWVAGFAFGLLGVLVSGARMVISNSQDAGTVLDLIERERPTVTNGYYPTVNWIAQDPEFARRDLSWLRRGNLWPILARDARPPDPSYRHDLYGMSEAGSAISMSADEENLPQHLRGAAGKICPGFEAKIVDPETGGESAPGEVGELWIRGHLMMEGYYGKLRSEVFTPDGWLRSSDAVAIDNEGYVFLKGRLGTMIKTAGANVAPSEVESVIRELTGGKLCIVVGIPDLTRGQAVVGIVIDETGSGVDTELLLAGLREKLSSYKVPRMILVWDQDRMPTLSSGKIDMTRLVKEAEEACAAMSTIQSE